VYAIKQKVFVFGHFFLCPYWKTLASEGFAKWHGGWKERYSQL